MIVFAQSNLATQAAWIAFGGAVVGGIFVLLGTVVGQLLIDRLARKRAEDARYHEAERLFGETHYYLNKESRRRYRDQLKNRELSDEEISFLIGRLIRTIESKRNIREKNQD